MELNLAEKQIA